MPDLMVTLFAKSHGVSQYLISSFMRVYRRLQLSTRMQVVIFSHSKQHLISQWKGRNQILSATFSV